ncbi:hypothetical protein FSP39_015986 [Pinctada imbricata]|uniref:Uncharacterized protein n=1 Tax=Pinctada imbricata TaxID=66713 RepID=A0AA89BMI7_PINIB|nr:hypothetical protein FSP39_015986 [Pinctada imbricata]
MAFNNDIKILTMNRFYLQLISFLEDAGKNVDKFITGELLPFGEDTHVKRDVVYENLIKENKVDDDVETILSVVLPAMAKLAKKLFKDHLPGGTFDNPSEEVIAATIGTAKHNKFSESVFAYLDGLMRSKPHIKYLSSEAYIMFSHNKTREWLASKDKETMRMELKDAYRKIGTTRKLFKDRQNAIRERKQEILRERQRKQGKRKLKSLFLKRMKLYTGVCGKRSSKWMM